MRDLAVLFVHLIATVARLLGRGGARSVVAESLVHVLHYPLAAGDARRRPTAEPMAAARVRPARPLRLRVGPSARGTLGARPFAPVAFNADRRGKLKS